MRRIVAKCPPLRLRSDELFTAPNMHEMEIKKKALRAVSYEVLVYRKIWWAV
jgi:hypothetical protein